MDRLSNNSRHARSNKKTPPPAYSILPMRCMSWCCDISCLRTASLPKVPNMSKLNLGGTGDVQRPRASFRAHIRLSRSFVRQQCLSCRSSIQCSHVPYSVKYMYSERYILFRCVVHVRRRVVPPPRNHMFRNHTPRQWQNTWEDNRNAPNASGTLEIRLIH